MIEMGVRQDAGTSAFLPLRFCQIHRRAARLLILAFLLGGYAISASRTAAQQAAAPKSGTQAAKPASKAAFPPDIVEYFSGEWSGKGRFTSGRELESKFSFAPDLEKQCMVVRHEEEPPNTYKFIALWSVDSETGDQVMLLTSNHDAGARVFRSRGWQGHRLVFESAPELHAFFAIERMTFERDSPTTFHTTYEMSMDGGKTWRVGDHQSFTRNAQSE